MTLLFLLVAGCASPPVPSPGASPTPAPDDDAVAVFLRDLSANGTDARLGGAFDPTPISNLGVQVCVSGESINVFVFPTPGQAADRAAMIDRRDPSHFGNAMIIDWAGDPKFWLRDELVVLYLGNDAELTERLVTFLGDPFASGLGRPPLRGEDAC